LTPIAWDTRPIHKQWLTTSLFNTNLIKVASFGKNAPLVLDEMKRINAQLKPQQYKHQNISQFPLISLSDSDNSYQ
jgi:hypothetical protein